MLLWIYLLFIRLNLNVVFIPRCVIKAVQDDIFAKICPSDCITLYIKMNTLSLYHIWSRSPLEPTYHYTLILWLLKALAVRVDSIRKFGPKITLCQLKSYMNSVKTILNGKKLTLNSARVTKVYGSRAPLWITLSVCLSVFVSRLCFYTNLYFLQFHQRIHLTNILIKQLLFFLFFNLSNAWTIRPFVFFY